MSTLVDGSQDADLLIYTTIRSIEHFPFSQSYLSLISTQELHQLALFSSPFFAACNQRNGPGTDCRADSGRWREQHASPTTTWKSRIADEWFTSPGD
jgi:hypothetical protein